MLHAVVKSQSVDEFIYDYDDIRNCHLFSELKQNHGGHKFKSCDVQVIADDRSTGNRKDRPVI